MLACWYHDTNRRKALIHRATTGLHFARSDRNGAKSWQSDAEIQRSCVIYDSSRRCDAMSSKQSQCSFGGISSNDKGRLEILKATLNIS